jgi:hypothetical protein
MAEWRPFCPEGVMPAAQSLAKPMTQQINEFL